MKSFLLAVVLVLASFSSAAALVSVNANVSWSCGTGTGGFDGLCPGDGYPDVERGDVAFIYSTDIPDSDPSTMSGLFNGAILGFAMKIDLRRCTGVCPVFDPDPNAGTVSYQTLLFTLSGGPNSISLRPNSLGDLGFTLDLYAHDANNGYPDVHFVLSSLGQGQANRNPNVLPGADFWNRPVISAPGNAYLQGGCYSNAANLSVCSVGETDWATNFSAIQVPEPSSLSLLGLAGLAGLAASRRRKPSSANASDQPHFGGAW